MVGVMVSFTLGVAAFEIFRGSSALPDVDKTGDHSLMLIQCALLYCAFICLGGAMDCFLARRSRNDPEPSAWPKNLSDDEMGHRPNRGAAHEG